MKPSNDNKRNAKLVPRFAWDIYRAASRADGLVVSKRPPQMPHMETAAVTHKADIRKLIAVRRREVPCSWERGSTLCSR